VPPLPDALLTTEDVVIARPKGRRRGGGDRVFHTLYSGLRAQVTYEEEFTRDAGAQANSRHLRVRLRLHAHDGEGRPIDVQGEDVISFPDYRGIRQEVEVSTAHPVYDGLGALDFLRVEARPVGE